MNRARTITLALGTALVLFGGAGVRLATSAHRSAGRVAAPLALEVNIPAFRLDVYEHGRRTRSYSVSVGAPGHETPTGSYRVSRAVWNPWWRPPSSDWAKDEEIAPPGPANPMGRVKLYFTGMYYIHGTPLEGTVAEPASHGCIRMRNADVLELARTIHGYATPDLSQRALTRILRSGRTRSIALGRRVPLRVVYRLAEVREGHLVLYPDVYGRSPVDAATAARRALRAAGYDLATLDGARLADAARRSRSDYVVVPLRTLLSGEATAAAVPRSTLE